MAEEAEEAQAAREIVDRNLYLVLATADLSGQPWAIAGLLRALATTGSTSGSRTRMRSTRVNLRDRREVGIVIFDSTVPINTGRGVYMSGVAHELPAHETAEGIEIFSRRSVGHGGGALSEEDVTPPSRHRLYQATAEALYVLDEHDHRVEVNL